MNIIKLESKLESLQWVDEKNLSIKDCNLCDRRDGDNLVSPIQNVDAEWFIQGASPSEYEVRVKELFPSESSGGRLFGKYIQALGVGRDQCYITNTCFCGKERAPSIRESSVCAGWKKKEWGKLSNIKGVILLGNSAIRQHFGYDVVSVVYKNGAVIESELWGRKLLFLLVHHPGHIYRRGLLIKETLEKIQKFVDLCKEGI